MEKEGRRDQAGEASLERGALRHRGWGGASHKPARGRAPQTEAQAWPVQSPRGGGGAGEGRSLVLLETERV